MTKREGKIDLSGHALRVYVQKQLGKDSKYQKWKAKMRAEATVSGQTGARGISDHEKEEYTELERIEEMKKDAAEAQVEIKDHKTLLKSIKDQQLGDEIWRKAMASEEGKKASLKSLSKQAKAVETKIKVLTDASKGTSRRSDIVAGHLSQNEIWILNKHEELKAERKAAAGTGTEESVYDSDENANRGGHKRSAFRATNDAILRMQQSMHTPRLQQIWRRR